MTEEQHKNIRDKQWWGESMTVAKSLKWSGQKCVAVATALSHRQFVELSSNLPFTLSTV